MKTKKTKNKNLSKTIQLQKKIYSSLKKQVDIVLGATPHSIQRYKKENHVDLHTSQRKKLEPVSKEALISALVASDVSLIGDFHTLREAQRTALRLIESAVETTRKNQKDSQRDSPTVWVIGIEFISSQFQKELDQFQAEEITLAVFHQAISYNDSWGFPWSHYEPLFTWAKENKIRLIALNRPKLGFFKAENHKELLERDQWAAGIITDIFYNELISKKANSQSNPKTVLKMVVLFGEHHIGTPHLPLQIKKISHSLLKKPLSCLSIYQNEDDLYWRVTEAFRGFDVSAIQLNAHAFCIFSSPPWTKLQSILTWAEGSSGESLDEWDVDYLSLFQNYTRFICDFLGVNSPSLDHLTIETIGNIGGIKNILKNPLDQRLVQLHIQNNIRLMIPKKNIIYLGTPSSNRVAEMAGIYLLRSVMGTDHLFNLSTDDFYRLILEGSFGYFASLLINPKRKCDLLEDHQRRLRRLNREREAFPGERDARRLTIKFLQDRGSKRSQKSLGAALALEKIVTRKGQAFSTMIAAKYIGQILGKKLHQAVVAGTFPIAFLKTEFLVTSGGVASHFQSRVTNLSQMIAGIKLEEAESQIL